MAQQPVDAQTISDTSLHVFEAIATLEYTGRRPSRAMIAAVARLDDAALDQALTELAAAGLLSVTEEDSRAVYVPASRDWSTQPGDAAGHPMA